MLTAAEQASYAARRARSVAGNAISEFRARREWVEMDREKACAGLFYAETDEERDDAVATVEAAEAELAVIAREISRAEAARRYLDVRI